MQAPAPKISQMVQFRLQGGHKGQFRLQRSLKHRLRLQRGQKGQFRLQRSQRPTPEGSAATKVPKMIRIYRSQKAGYILYVQEIVTLHKKYSNIFASENKVYTVFNYYDILGLILFVYRAK